MFPADDPHNERAIRESFARQGFNSTLGAELTHIGAGTVSIALPFSTHLTQQNGFLHAAVTAAIADNACGYAAMTLAPPQHNPLAVEFKVNLLAPAAGERFEARATVLRRGKTLSVMRADVFALRNGREELIATMLETAILRPTA